MNKVRILFHLSTWHKFLYSYITLKRNTSHNCDTLYGNLSNEGTQLTWCKFVRSYRGSIISNYLHALAREKANLNENWRTCWLSYILESSHAITCCSFEQLKYYYILQTPRRVYISRYHKCSRGTYDRRASYHPRIL